MSFLFYHFLKNPDKMLKAQKEVDEVLGSNPIEISHLPKLKYIDACIKVWPSSSQSLVPMLTHSRRR